MASGDPTRDAAGPSCTPRGCAARGPRELVRLIYAVDPLICPKCGGPLRVIAVIQAPKVIDKILRHLRAKGRDPRAGPGATGPPGSRADAAAAGAAGGPQLKQ